MTEEAAGYHRMLTDDERERMVSTLHSLVYWVGVLVPEYELVGDHEIELRDIVYRLTTADHLSEEDVARIERLIGRLKQREKELERKLAHDPMTMDAAKALLEEARGLLKAIDELRSAESEDHASVRREEALARVRDARRWHDFIESVKARG